MCGIAGFVGGTWPGTDKARALLDRMGECLRHRGPDSSGIWLDEQSAIGLAHRRLAIIDVSAAGNQPMLSHSGRHVIIYNGEIYNHLAIRDELAAGGFAVDWTGHSDTETLLAAIEAWGVRGAVERATGMFAFALWDKQGRTLTLARDRLGEKPLYYGRQGGPDACFLFGSELKALAQHGGFQREVDRDALGLLLRYGYIPAPFSIYRGIHKLPAGAILTLTDGAAEPLIERYWSGAAVAEAGAGDVMRLGDDEAVDRLEQLLGNAVSGQLLADVPLGALLSGGIDSSTIVALMQKLSPRPVNTFTIGFHEDGYDEAGHAKAVARHLGTHHTEFYVSPAEARDLIPRLPAIYDEPFGDSSQIPTYIVSALARQHVTVALSGDGGDEMFGGYNRYLLTNALWDRIGRVPKRLRVLAGRGLATVPAAAWTRLGNAAGVMLPRLARVNRLGDLLHKGAGLLGSESVAELYSGMLSHWREPADVVIGAANVAPLPAQLDGLADVERMMALDMLGYLPDDILVKVDRAAMAASLETRAPFLDRHLVEFAWRLPLDLKLRGGETKWILRRLLARHVPLELVERPKMGFGAPVGAWLMGPLRDWAEALLDERRLRREGYFKPEPIRDSWRAHLTGKVNEVARLWPVLMFQAWLDSENGPRPAQ